MSLGSILDTKKKVAQTPIPARSLPKAHSFDTPRNLELERSSTLPGHAFDRLPVHSSPVTAGSCPLSLASPRTCPFGGACHTCPPRVQAKLAIGKSDDPFEQEADRVADEIIASSSSFGQIENSYSAERQLNDPVPPHLSPNPHPGKLLYRAPMAEEASPVIEESEDEEFEVGNTMDVVAGETPLEALVAPPHIVKGPEAKSKMGGPLGEVQEGLGKPAGPLPTACADWIKLTRTTYPYDPNKGADPMEKELVTTYKNFKEGIAISKPGDFNSKLINATANPCTCLAGLNIDGHGASWSGGGQEFAPRKYSLGKRSFGVKKGRGGKLVPYNFDIFNKISFCKPCTITLGGCYVALNKPHKEAGASGFKGAGDALGNALAAKTGCSVKAYTGTTITEKAGEFKAHGKGSWVEWKPKEAKP